MSASSRARLWSRAEGLVEPIEGRQVMIPGTLTVAAAARPAELPHLPPARQDGR
jgi:hypothetical protein